jgi:hypothetical protein
MNFLLAFFQVIFLYIVIAIAWMAAEKVFYGKRTPRLLDDIVAIILAVSIYFNIW